jgi:hypothetical protein
MTLRIERASDGPRTLLRLIGRIGFEHLGELRVQIAPCGPNLVIDLEEVSLVDVEAVRFLVACEKDGAVISNPSPYIREWMSRERGVKS